MKTLNGEDSFSAFVFFFMIFPAYLCFDCETSRKCVNACAHAAVDAHLPRAVQLLCSWLKKRTARCILLVSCSQLVLMLQSTSSRCVATQRFCCAAGSRRRAIQMGHITGTVGPAPLVRDARTSPLNWGPRSPLVMWNAHVPNAAVEGSQPLSVTSSINCDVRPPPRGGSPAPSPYRKYYVTWGPGPRRRRTARRAGP